MQLLLTGIITLHGQCESHYVVSMYYGCKAGPHKSWHKQQLRAFFVHSAVLQVFVPLAIFIICQMACSVKCLCKQFVLSHNIAEGETQHTRVLYLMACRNPNGNH